jgi:hypothetical protein
MTVIIRSCSLSEAASKYYNRYKDRLLKEAKTEKQKNSISQRRLLSDLVELHHAFEEHMGVDIETFLTHRND